MVIREQLVAGLIVAQQLFGHRDFVHLGRPIGQPHLEGAHDVAGKGHFFTDAQRTMHMQGAGGDVMQHLGHDSLHCGDVLAHSLVVLVLIDAPRRAHHQQAKLLQLDP
ncbi:hypothetical protein D3C81_1789010 [compost metagenome]